MRRSLLTTCCYLSGSLLLLAGCNSKDAEFKPVKQGENRVTDTAGGHDHGHDHGHAHGPHDGHVIELGEEEYHAELVFDEKSKALGVYLFGADLKTPELIGAADVALNLMLAGKPVQLKLPAAPLEGEGDGKSSHFELTGNVEVAAHAQDAEDLIGKLQVTINGKQYVGAISHDHGHGHDDDHGHDDAHGHDDGHGHDDDHGHDEK